MSSAGKSLTLAEASAMKLYSAQAASDVAMEAVQLFGGNGYMAEFRVEQLARDAKVFQIYAGTDEIQVTHIARDLLEPLNGLVAVADLLRLGPPSTPSSTTWSTCAGPCTASPSWPSPNTPPPR